MTWGAALIAASTAARLSSMKPQSKQRFDVQVVVHLRRARLQRRAHVDDGRQLLDVELDRLGRVARLRQRLGDHRGDRVAHVAHLALRQHRVLRLRHRLAEAVGHLPAAGNAADRLEVLAR